MNGLVARLVFGITERLVGLAKAGDGATAVETAIVLPAFLLLLFAVIEGGLLFWTQSTLQFAVEAAARCEGTELEGGQSNAMRKHQRRQSYAASQVSA